MRWDVYADLSRPITVDEQRTIFAALDSLVPDSGCVGPNKSGDGEAYFTVEAASMPEAHDTATRAMDAVLQQASVSIAYAITVHPRSTASPPTSSGAAED